MPEGPEVRIVSEYLNQQLTNCRIISLVAHVTSKVKNVPSNLTNYTITQVKCKGKSIIMFLIDDLGHHSFLESKLAMEGKWELFPSKHNILTLTVSKPTTDPNFNIITHFHFNDTRHFGSLSFHLNFDDLNTRVGFDLLDYILNKPEQLQLDPSQLELLPYYTKLISNSRIGSKDITYFLMNQKYFSGIGNYLKAEVLYYSKLFPGTKLNQLTLPIVAQLLYYSLLLIRQSYICNGLTIRTYISPSGKLGTFDTLVYSHSQDPNGYPIIKHEFDDKRTTHYCPAIQVPIQLN